MSKENGGPAFPGGSFINVEYALQSDGMTLRDYIAVQALTGSLAAVSERDIDDMADLSTEQRGQMFAQHAYMMADFMLVERDK